MNKYIDLCKILKGHEGETFYSPINGNIKLHHIQLGQEYPIIFLDEDEDFVSCCKDGKPYIYAKECLVFPSKDQRDWNKWDKENNKKIPKTWNKYLNHPKYKAISTISLSLDGEDYFTNSTPIEKSAFALLKIHQLIEVGYGGNVSKKEWNFTNSDCPICYIGYNHEDRNFFIGKSLTSQVSPILFHTVKQAKEFLSYPENVQLLKDYFMFND